MFSFNELPVFDEKKFYDGILSLSELIGNAASSVASNVVQATTSVINDAATPVEDPLAKRLKKARQRLEETRSEFEAHKQEIAVLQSEVLKARKVDEVSVMSSSIFNTSYANQHSAKGKVVALTMEEEALSRDQVAVTDTLATINVAIGSLNDDLNTAIKIEEAKIEEESKKQTLGC